MDPLAPGCLLHAAPMSHGSGLYLVPHVMQGIQVVPESGQFDPAEIFDLLETWREVSMFAAPTMVKRLVDLPKACRRASGSAPSLTAALRCTWPTSNPPSAGSGSASPSSTARAKSR